MFKQDYFKVQNTAYFIAIRIQNFYFWIIGEWSHEFKFAEINIIIVATE